MRVIVAFEGENTVPKQVLEHGSVRWAEDKPIPVTDWENNTQKITGTAKDFQRDENGCVTAEVEFTDENVKTLIDAGEIALTVYGNQVDDSRRDDGTRVVHSFQLLALYPTLGVPWVGLKPGDKLRKRS
jgi:hypothetical protein